LVGRSRSVAALVVLASVVIGLFVLAGSGFAPAQPANGQSADLRVLGQPPLTWDPAQAGDTSTAAVLAQVFEGLAALDPDNNVQPALAQSWQVSANGLTVDFQLRPGIVYSDGTPIVAQDVVASWLRLLDPQHPSPLASLLDDVSGANDYLNGRTGAAGVGLEAVGTDHVVVRLRRPASYFIAVTTSPALAVVPPSMFGAFNGDSLPGGLVVSGAYVPTSADASSIVLAANPRYWAGRPALGTVEVVLDTGNQSPIDMFESGNLDYLPIGSYDAAWIQYDQSLGPQLRQTADLQVQYYGFDTTSPPFDDPQVRLAFAQAVNWDRIVRLAGDTPALSMVPPGLRGGDTTDYRPSYDPNAARTLLAQAGYANGQGFPDIALVTTGFGYEPQVAAELKQELGINVTVEVADFTDILQRQAGGERFKFWDEIWAADYPHANDFLGLLLETGSASNQGGWSNTDYDNDIAAAAAATDPTQQAQAYADAQSIVRDQAPVVPVEASVGWALSRNGLLGALPSGAGYLRFAGMAWASGQ
jgi:oligopeptide transport system substrate-binding protein